MNELKAFIAHSFSPADRDLVNIFVDHFRTLARAYQEFTWDHAEEAEPATLSAKVLSKMEDKNLLIGICTQHELAVDNSALYQIPMTDRFMGKKISVQWKTSDWIIQEIGLAVGRRMNIILFLEEGVRAPGGLYGDTEYIQFSRKNPQASFDKLLQMLIALKPKEPVSASIGETNPQKAEDTSVEEEPNQDWEPNPDWDQEKYNRAAFGAVVFLRDKDAYERIDRAFRASPWAQGEALSLWEARREYLHFFAGEEGDFEKVKRLASDNPQNAEIIAYMARCYQQFDDHDRAAEKFEQASEIAKETADKIGYRISAAGEYARAGKNDRAGDIFEKVKPESITSSELQMRLLYGLRTLADITKDNDTLVAIMERFVELHPNDVSYRFSLAYKHSELGNADMALFHYTKIPAAQRTGTAWNNLGVAYGEFGMPVKSVTAYRKAEAANETLAMSNLGFKLLGAGFADEAQVECDKAQEHKPYHKNIHDLLKRLSEVGDEEDTKLSEALAKTRDKATFYGELGDTVVQATPQAVPEQWDSPDGVLQCKLEGAVIAIAGAQERPANPFSAGLTGVFASPPKMVMHRTTFSGRVFGNAIIGTIKRSRDGEQPTLLSLGTDSAVKVLMYFNSERTTLHVMENPHNASPSFYVLTARSGDKPTTSA